MTNGLVPHERASDLYQRMQTAITACHAIDDCKEIADQAQAIAAYFTQINDDHSLRNFLQIKLRAWLRIGQLISAVAGVYEAGTETQAKYCDRARARIDTGEISNSRIIQAVRLAQLPEEFFENNVSGHRSIDALLKVYQAVQREAWLATPEGQAATAQERELQRQAAEQYAQNLHQQEEQLTAQRRRQAEDAEDYKDYLESREAAFGEVGVTMDRRDRKEMKEIVFLIKRPVHDRLRKAAFDQRVTMQSILRAGLKMWFIAHDYDTSDL